MWPCSTAILEGTDCSYSYMSCKPVVLCKLYCIACRCDVSEREHTMAILHSTGVADIGTGGTASAEREARYRNTIKLQELVREAKFMQIRYWWCASAALRGLATFPRFVSV